MGPGLTPTALPDICAELVPKPIQLLPPPAFHFLGSRMQKSKNGPVQEYKSVV